MAGRPSPPHASAPAAAAPVAVSQVDVVAKLKGMAAANPQKPADNGGNIPKNLL